MNNSSDIPIILDDLFHEFLNAVNNIDFETQTFPLIVKSEGLENIMKFEDKTVEEKIALMLDTAKSQYDRARNLLASIEKTLSEAGVGDYKPFVQDITRVLRELKEKVDSIDTMYADMRKDEAEAILKEFLTLAPCFLSIKDIYSRFKDDLIAKGVYRAQ